jgi:hypothetical protein
MAEFDVEAGSLIIYLPLTKILGHSVGGVWRWKSHNYCIDSV